MSDEELEAVKMICPSPEDLVALAFDEAGLPHMERHVRSCDRCRSEVVRLRHSSAALRMSAVAQPKPLTPCLADEDLALLLDSRQPPRDAVAAHLLACGECSRRLAVSARLLKDESVATELRRLGAIERSDRRGLAAATAAASLAAAALLALLLLPREAAPPPQAATAPAIHRERAVTTTVAPRIVGPIGTAHAADSLRWTSVPHADRYEVSVFDRNGTLVWSPVTGDTVLSIPADLFGAEAVTYLWKVEARTGWDRRVASEWSDFTLAETVRR